MHPHIRAKRCKIHQCFEKNEQKILYNQAMYILLIVLMNSTSKNVQNVLTICSSQL